MKLTKEQIDARMTMWDEASSHMLGGGIADTDAEREAAEIVAKKIISVAARWYDAITKQK